MPRNTAFPHGHREHLSSVDMEMEDPRKYWYVLLRHRWLIAAVFIGILALTCVGTLLRTPLFKATALVRIDQGKINLVQDLTVEEGRTDLRELYGTQKRVLTSRPLVQRTMDRLDVWTHPLFEVESGGAIDAEAARDRQVNKLLSMLQVTHVRDTQLMEVGFVTPEPELSRDLANALVQEYIAYSVEADSGVARNTSSFIREQIEKLQRDIHEKESLLQEYGKQEDIVLEQSDEIVAQQLSDLHGELTRAQSALAATEARYLSLKQSDAGSNPDVFNNRTIQDLRQEYAKLEKEYAELGIKFEPGWPEMRRKRRAMEEVERRLELETKSLADKLLVSAHTTYQEALNRVNLLKRTLEEQREDMRGLNALTAEYNRIKVELESQQAMLQQLTRREGETGLSADLEERQQIKIGVVEEAVLPRKPFKPNLVLNLVVGGFIGIVLGPALAFFVNFWNSSIYTSEDLHRYVSVPCLAMIPHYDRERQLTGGNGGLLPASVKSGGKQQTALVRTAKQLSVSKRGHYPGKAELVERFKFLRNALLLSSPGNPPKTVLFTSTGEGEGKSFVACNFASSFAQLDKKVLLIDADLRRPYVHRFFGLQNKVGLTNVITGQASLEDGCVQSTNLSNLFVLLAGSKTPSPAELLSSKAMEEVLHRCTELFDVVVIDSAPLLLVVDSHALAVLSDKVLLVARSGATQGPAVKSAIELIEQAQGKVAGVVLNDVDLMDFAQSYYYRHYSYGYASYSSERERE